MKKLIYSFTIMIAVFGLLLSSCDENPVIPKKTESETNFPSKEGNYWVYQNVLVNGTTKEEDLTQKYIDSIYVLTPINNVIDTIFKHNTVIDVKNEMSLNSTYITSFKYQGSKLYADFAYIFPSQISMFNIMKGFLGNTTLNQFIVIADYKAIVPWTILPEVKFDSLNLPITGYDVKLSNVRYSIAGAKGLPTTVNVGAKSLTASEFIITHSIVADAKISGIPVGSLTVNLLIRNYYAPNYGLVKRVLEPASVKVGLLGNVSLTDGYNTTLIRYSIK